MARLAAQMNDVRKELQIQLTRIAQLQAQLDRFMVGGAPRAADRGAKKADRSH